MAYKIQPLVESGYDFAALFPEKQDAVRQSTGLEFYLDSIVKFLQKQTNNFTIDNPIAHDLDNAIYNLVQKAGVPMAEPMPAPMPMAEPMAEPTEEEKRQSYIEAIELLEMLGDDADESAKEAIDILKSLL
jgi:hypothetical protein